QWNMAQASPGKLDRLRRTPAGSTALAFDGTGLRDSSPARPPKDASYPVSVRQVAALLHTSFRRHLAMTPLCFASPSPPSGWTGDFHPQAIEHAGHTTNGALHLCIGIEGQGAIAAGNKADGRGHLEFAAACFVQLSAAHSRLEKVQLRFTHG